MHEAQLSISTVPVREKPRKPFSNLKLVRNRWGYDWCTFLVTIDGAAEQNVETGWEKWGKQYITFNFLLHGGVCCHGLGLFLISCFILQLLPRVSCCHVLLPAHLCSSVLVPLLCSCAPPQPHCPVPSISLPHPLVNSVFVFKPVLLLFVGSSVFIHASPVPVPRSSCVPVVPDLFLVVCP